MAFRANSTRCYSSLRSDERLLVAAKQGNHRAHDDFYETYYRMRLPLANQTAKGTMTFNHLGDAVDMAFLDTFRYCYHRYSPIKGSFISFFLTVYHSNLLHESFDQQKSLTVHAPISLDAEVGDEEGDLTWHEIIQSSDSTFSPEKQALGMSDFAFAAKRLGLSETTVEAVRLSEYGLNQTEIARAKKTSLYQVRLALRQAETYLSVEAPIEGWDKPKRRKPGRPKSRNARSRKTRIDKREE